MKNNLSIQLRRVHWRSYLNEIEEHIKIAKLISEDLDMSKVPHQRFTRVINEMQDSMVDLMEYLNEHRES